MHELSLLRSSMHVCVCVCMHVFCMYVCVCVCVCVLILFACVWILFACVWILFVCVFFLLLLWMCVFTFVCMCSVGIDICMRIAWFGVYVCAGACVGVSPISPRC